jgi:hypothetical protein
VKKLFQVERTGRDIGRISGKPPSGGNLPKVLQRYIFPLTTLDEKLQYSSLIAEPYYLSLQNDRICKTLKIFLPDLQSRFLHTFPPARGGEIEREPLSPRGERVG